MFTNMKISRMREEHYFNLIRIHVARRNFQKVYNIIKENKFSDTERVLKLWDSAHYAEKEQELGSTLSPLMKFRVREKNPPPKSILNGNRPKSTLPREATKALKKWLSGHIKNPYPSRQEKEKLAEATNITLKQVDNWFANARRRNQLVISLKTEANRDLSDSSGEEFTNKGLAFKNVRSKRRLSNFNNFSDEAQAQKDNEDVCELNVIHTYDIEMESGACDMEAGSSTSPMEISCYATEIPAISTDIAQDVVGFHDSNHEELKSGFLQLMPSTSEVSTNIAEIIEKID